MNLRILALLTKVMFLILVVIGFIFNVLVAYVPKNASSFEFIIYHIIFMTIKTVVLVTLFLHRLKTAKIDLDTESLKKIFS